MTEVYVTRDVSATLIKTKDHEKLGFLSIFKLLEEREDEYFSRIFITGEAGSGKTSLLRHITNSWLVGREVPYDLVFHMPLGRSRSHNIPDIICQDLNLLPKTWKESLSQILEMEAVRKLFLLDSYEELFFPTEELEKLIKGELYPDSTVVVTTRPGSKLAEFQPRVFPRVELHLQDFSEREVSQYVSQYFASTNPVPNIDAYFFGNHFLQRPFNLALACYLYDLHSKQTDGANPAPLTLPTTQTVLLSQIVQLVVQAYIKKKKNTSISLTEGSPLSSKVLPCEVKALIKEISKMCYEAFQEKEQSLNTDGDCIFTTSDLIDFGLFSAGSRQNSVTLPHSLFQEYLAAMYLVADKKAFEALYVEVEGKRGSSSARLCLQDAVGRLENAIKFVVGLSPRAAEKLSNLFVIKQLDLIVQKDLQADLDYELTLLNECSDETAKSAMAKALLKAPVSPGHRTNRKAKNESAPQLLQYFTEEECLIFMEKAYGCRSENNNGFATITWTEPGKRFLWDDFCLRFVEKYNYFLQVDRVTISTSNMSVGLLAYNMADVGRIVLSRSSFCEGSMSAGNGNCVALPESRRLHTGSGKSCHLILMLVEGLQHLESVTLPDRDRLWLHHSREADLNVLPSVFTGISELEFGHTTLVYSPEVRQFIHLRSMMLKECLNNVFLDKLAAMCPRLEELVIVECKVVLDYPARWLSVTRLIVQYSPVRAGTVTGEQLSESTVREMLSEMCPIAEIYVYESPVCRNHAISLHQFLIVYP